jgi:hypothetical protein
MSSNDTKKSASPDRKHRHRQADNRFQQVVQRIAYCLHFPPGKTQRDHGAQHVELLQQRLGRYRGVAFDLNAGAAIVGKVRLGFKGKSLFAGEGISSTRLVFRWTASTA